MTHTSRTVPLTVLSSVSSDAHTWNLVYLQLVLEEHGHQVLNLGACVPDDELVRACLRSRPDLLVVSSVNGHGAQDAGRMVQAVRARPELRDLPAVLGGKLGVDGPLPADRLVELTDAGFDRVFAEHDGIDPFLDYLAAVPGRVAGRVAAGRVAA